MTIAGPAAYVEALDATVELRWSKLHSGDGHAVRFERRTEQDEACGAERLDIGGACPNDRPCAIHDAATVVPA